MLHANDMPRGQTDMAPRAVRNEGVCIARAESAPSIRETNGGDCRAISPLSERYGFSVFSAPAFPSISLACGGVHRRRQRSEEEDEAMAGMHGLSAAGAASLGSFQGGAPSALLPRYDCHLPEAGRGGAVVAAAGSSLPAPDRPFRFSRCIFLTFSSHLTPFVE